MADGRELLGICLPSVIDKTRHEVMHAGHIWEVDVFHGDNAGLIVAEVKLTDESVAPVLLGWVGAEVSADERYFNSRLAGAPYHKWVDLLDPASHERRWPPPPFALKCDQWCLKRASYS